MDRRRYLEASGLVATAVVTGLAGCPQGDDGGNGGGEDGDGETPTETPEDTDGGTPEDGDGGGGQNTVAMETEDDEHYFDPIGLFVESGTTVTFENVSGAHSSTAYEEGNGPAEETLIPEGAEAWDSGTLSDEGATFEHTFETAGTYDYFCIPHKSLGMVGRIVVDEPGGPATEGMPPDGDVPESQTIVDEESVSYDDFG